MACKPISAFTYLGIFGHVDGYADWGGGWGVLYKLFVCGFDIIMHFYSLGLPAGYSYSLAILSSSDFLPTCCSACELQYMVRISRVTCI